MSRDVDEPKRSPNRAGAATKALLARIEAERTEVEDVLIDLAGALAEADAGLLVHSLLDALRRVAGASFGIYLPDGLGPSGPAERTTLGPSGPAERTTPGPSGPAERTTLSPSGPAEGAAEDPSDGAAEGEQVFACGADHVAFKEPPVVQEAPLLAAALRSGDVLVIDDLLRWARSRDAKLPYGILEGGGVVRSWLVMPVGGAAGGSHGTVVLGHSEAHRFDDRRERLAKAVGHHLAGVLDRARADVERSRVARILQATLLPPVMPVVPGVDLAARYRAAGATNVVGGDFYDVFEVDGGAWAVVLGDVSGVGPEAAAITGQARYTVRAVARNEPTPSGVLRRLNDAIGGRSDDRFCTAVYLRMQPQPDGVEVMLSRGGHPPPLLLRDGGLVEPLDAAAGFPLGMFADAAVSDVGCTLGPGDAIVLYTDGVIEARDATGEQFGQERLEALLATCAGRTADGIARRVELAAMDFQGDTASDDVAIVVARAHPAGGRESA